MKKIKVILCAVVLFLATSNVFASEIGNSINKAKNEKKLLFLLCAEPNSKHAAKIKKWIKSGQIKLSKKYFVYKSVTISTKEQKEDLMMNFNITEEDKGPFVCIADQNGNEFQTLKGKKALKTYKKLVKLSKTHYKAVRAVNKKK